MCRGAFFVLLLCCVVGNGHAACVEYSDLPRWISQVPLPGGNFSGVAVSGHYAYVADGVYGLQVVDVADTLHPAWIASLPTPREASDVAVSGNTVYLATYVDQLAAGLWVIDVSNPGSPHLVGEYAGNYGPAYGVALAGNYACLATGGGDLAIIDISVPGNPHRVGSAPTGGAYDVAVQGIYAYVATASRLFVVDISNPAAPLIAGSAEVGSSSVAVSGSIACLGADGGFRVLDISNPHAPVVVGALDLHATWSVAIKGELALVPTCDAMLRVVDISDPWHPVVAASVNTGHSTAVAVSGPYAYSSGGGISIVRINHPRGNSLLGTVPLSALAADVAVQANKAYLALNDWWDGTPQLRVIDVSDPRNPWVLGTADLGVTTQSVVVEGGYAFVTMADHTYYGGLTMVDVSDAMHPAPTGSVWLTCAPRGLAVSGGRALVADASCGLVLVDVAHPPSVQIEATVNTPGDTYGVAVSGRYAYVADGTNGLLVVDLEAASGPAIVGHASTLAVARGVALYQHYACVAVGTSGLQVIDISNPSSPQPTGNVPLPGDVSRISILGARAYLLSDHQGIHAVDIADPSHPRFLGTMGSYWPQGVASSRSRVYFTDFSEGLEIAIPDCDPTPGACCAGNGSCVLASVEECSMAWMGPGTVCSPNPCAQPGACCAGTVCLVLSEEDCRAAGGTFQGGTVPCAPNPCATSGVTESEQAPGIVSVSPNPFPRATTVSCRLPAGGAAVLEVLSADGRLVNRLPASSPAGGAASIAWDGRDLEGRPAPSGIYWLRLTGDHLVDQKVVVRLR